MINYEQLEDAALFGLEESIANGGEVDDDCWSIDAHGLKDRYQDSEIAEAIYAKYMGWA